jgi:hypothetical protein
LDASGDATDNETKISDTTAAPQLSPDATDGGKEEVDNPWVNTESTEEPSDKSKSADADGEADGGKHDESASQNALSGETKSTDVVASGEAEGEGKQAEPVSQDAGSGETVKSDAEEVGGKDEPVSKEAVTPASTSDDVATPVVANAPSTA